MKPFEVPSSITAGGTTGMTKASWMPPNSGPKARAAMAWAEASGAVRSDQSRSSTNIIAMFWPCPAKEKPRTAKTPLTFAFSVFSQ